MPTYRDCIEIDVLEFETCEMIALMSLAQVGRLIRKINKSYKAGDYEWLRSLPFIRKVYPKSSPFYRRHIPMHVRREVLGSGPCMRCGTLERLTVDHITPVSKGGSDDRNNLQPMCSFCNISKGNR